MDKLTANSGYSDVKMVPAIRNPLTSIILPVLFGALALFCECASPLCAQTFYVSSANDVLAVNSVGTVKTYATFTANAESSGLAIDSAGNLYVGDSSYSVIRKVTPTGTSSVFASLPANSAAVAGLAFDTSGNLYVADGNIFKVNSGGGISTFATLPANAFPQGLAFDTSGNLYATDGNNAQIDKITSAGAVSTFASLTANSSPYGLAFDSSGNLYTAGLQTSQISRITAAGAVSTFATLPANSYPEGLSFDRNGNLYTSDIYSGQISEISSTGVVTTFASNIQNPSFLALIPAPEPSPWMIFLVVGVGLIIIHWKRHLSA